jgi:hypothetical protein
MKLLPFLLLFVAPAVAQTAPADAPAGAKALLTLTGVGFQVYACKASPAGPAWTLVAPQAKLVDEHGAEVGFHGKGPAWTLNHGGSVKGELVATQPSHDPKAIPWLLLKAVEAKGTLGGVQFIRRSETKGGKARATGCDKGHLDATDLVGYKATYTFYTIVP